MTNRRRQMMRNSWRISKTVITTVVITILIEVVTLWFVFNHYPYLLRPESSISLIDIPADTQNMYKAKYVSISAGTAISSGCELDPGSQIFLTSLHGISNALLDGDDILVNGQKAYVIKKSRTNESDYAFLTTNPKLIKSKVDLPEHTFQLNEDLIILGSPGNEKALVQPAKIINRSIDSEYNQTFVASKSVYTLYVLPGISGGCVFPVGSEKPVAVFTKKIPDPDKESRFGGISFTNKTAE